MMGREGQHHDRSATSLPLELELFGFPLAFLRSFKFLVLVES